MRRVVVAAPSYLARRGTPQRPADIASHDVVVFGGLGAASWDFGVDGSVRLSPRLTVSTAEAAIDAVTEGTGITRVLGYQAVDALARGLPRSSGCWSRDSVMSFRRAAQRRARNP